jgi:hypothetical protein
MGGNTRWYRTDSVRYVQHLQTEGGKCVEHVRGKVQAGETKMYNLLHFEKKTGCQAFYAVIPNWLPPARPLTHMGGGGGAILACERGGEGIQTKGQTLWYSRYSKIPLRAGDISLLNVLLHTYFLSVRSRTIFSKFAKVNIEQENSQGTR